MGVFVTCLVASSLLQAEMSEMTKPIAAIFKLLLSMLIIFPFNYCAHGSLIGSAIFKFFFWKMPSRLL